MPQWDSGRLAPNQHLCLGKFLVGREWISWVSNVVLLQVNSVTSPSVWDSTTNLFMFFNSPGFFFSKIVT